MKQKYAKPKKYIFLTTKDTYYAKEDYKSQNNVFKLKENEHLL